MNVNEFVEYCKDKYIGKVVALKCQMYLHGNDHITLFPSGYTDVINSICIIDSNNSIKFCFEKYCKILGFYVFREVNPLGGRRMVSDLFEIVDN